MEKTPGGGPHLLSVKDLQKNQLKAETRFKSGASHVHPHHSFFFVAFIYPSWR
jgi:hypothetical protein